MKWIIDFAHLIIMVVNHLWMEILLGNLLHRLYGNDFPGFKPCLIWKRNSDPTQYDDPSSNDVYVILKIYTGSLNCIANLYLFSILSYYLMVRMVTILKFHSQIRSGRLLQNVKKGQLEHIMLM
uniref:Uncharacterized protein n=1 Tax=Salix viminalis TaxID=40686 RepID=A0A6N2LMY1_SALVM